MRSLFAIHGFFAVLSLRRRFAILTFQLAPLGELSMSDSFFLRCFISALTICSQLFSLSSFRSTPSQSIIGVFSAMSFASAFFASALPRNHPRQYCLANASRLRGHPSSTSFSRSWYLRMPPCVSGSSQSESRVVRSSGACRDCLKYFGKLESV